MGETIPFWKNRRKASVRRGLSALPLRAAAAASTAVAAIATWRALREMFHDDDRPWGKGLWNSLKDQPNGAARASPTFGASGSHSDLPKYGRRSQMDLAVHADRGSLAALQAGTIGPNRGADLALPEDIRRPIRHSHPELTAQYDGTTWGMQSMMQTMMHRAHVTPHGVIDDLAPATAAARHYTDLTSPAFWEATLADPDKPPPGFLFELRAGWALVGTGWEQCWEG